MKKLLHKTKACLFGFEYLSRGLDYPEEEKTPERESYAEILNKLEVPEEGEDVFRRFIPFVVLALAFVILRAGYFLFIHEHQLP